MSDKKPSTEDISEPNKTKEDKSPNLKIDPDAMPEEFGGKKGPEPTRYGDWENGGRCTDF